MPRAKSGNPPWPMIACKLPPDELDQLRRYADIHRCSISEVLRQGLALKLAGAAPVAPPPQHIPVDVLLTDALRHGMNCPQCRQEYESNSLTSTSQEKVSRLTSTDTLESNGLTTITEREVSRLTPPEPTALDAIPAPASYDTTRHQLGELCAHGHDFMGTGQSLRYQAKRKKDQACVVCKAVRQKRYNAKGASESVEAVPTAHNSR